MNGARGSVLVNGYGAYHGGIVRVHNAICRALLERGHEVYVANAPRAQEEISGLRVLSRQTESRAVSLRRDVIASLAFDTFDVRVDSAPAFRAFTRSRRRCVVIHDLNFLEPSTHDLSVKQLWYRRVLNAWSLRRSGLVIVNSDATRAEVLSYCPSAAPKVHVQPLPSELPATGARWSPRQPADLELRLLAFGHARNKGVDHLLRLMAVDPSVTLSVVAPEAQWERFWAPLASSLGVTERVRVLAGISDEELVSEYLNCDVFCMLSDYEGYGLPVAEALSLGVPTVISPLPVLRATGQGYPVVVAAMDPAAVRTSLHDARGTSPEHWAAAAKHFAAATWERWVDQMMEALDG